MSEPLRLGIAGLGTVGMGVVKIVQAHGDMLARRAGRPIAITAVSARDRTRNRDADLSGYAWESDPVTLARRDDVDLFIEVMGGDNGPAKAATEAAIAAGKDVVTANKALLAHHGQALAEAAERGGPRHPVRGRGGGRHPGGEGTDRGAGRERDPPGNGRDERHLQLYPDTDGKRGPAL